MSKAVDRFVWVLIGSTAIAAMVVGHALQLTLESRGVFGDTRAVYQHSGQMFALEMAGLVFVLVLALLARRLVHLAMHARPAGDCVLPALHGVAALGFFRIAAGLLSIQFGALLGTELLEERWSGFRGDGIASVFGPGHATAIAVHLIIGALAALVLLHVSSYVCAQTRALVKTVAAFLRRLPRPARCAPRSGFATSAISAADSKLEVLALGIANRPPPITSSLAA